MATILHIVTVRRLYIEVTSDREEGVGPGKVHDVFTYIRRHSRADGGADGHRRTAVGEIRSISDNKRSVMRSSPSSGYLVMTAIARTFRVIFMTIIALITVGLTSSGSTTSM